MEKIFHSQSETQTFRCAEKLGSQLHPGNIVALTGEIGSGKTVFIKGLSRGLSVKNQDDVKSPTFVLMHIYPARIPIYHFDFYRLERESELDVIGFDEFVSDSKAVSLVEWADRARGRIPKNAIWIRIEITGMHSRRIVFARQRSKDGRSNLKVSRLLRRPSASSQ